MSFFDWILGDKDYNKKVQQDYEHYKDLCPDIELYYDTYTQGYYIKYKLEAQNNRVSVSPLWSKTQIHAKEDFVNFCKDIIKRRNRSEILL